MKLTVETYPGETWSLESEGPEISAKPNWNWQRYQKKQPGIEQFISDFSDSRCEVPADTLSALKESAFCEHLGLKGKLSDLGIKAISKSHP